MNGNQVVQYLVRGPSADFDSGQVKLYKAAKMQQINQKRHIINDQLMPFDSAEAFTILQDSYKKNLKQS